MRKESKGDYSLATGRSILRNAIWQLRKEKDLRGPFQSPWKDSRGTYGLTISIPAQGEEHRIVLLSRGNMLYQGKLSSREDPLLFSRDSDIPLMVALEFPDKKIRYFLFSSKEVWASKEKSESARNVYLWPFDLGVEWFLKDPISVPLDVLERRLESKKERRRKTGKTLFDFSKEEFHG